MSGESCAAYVGGRSESSGSLKLSEALINAFFALLKDAKDNDPPTLQKCLEAALQTELPKYSASRFLAPYGMDMPAFLSSGRDRFTNEV